MSLEQRNEELDEKLKNSDLPKAVSVLIKDARTRKRQLRILAVSIILDIILTVGLGLVSVRTHNIAAQAENNHEAIIRSCETSNEARANNKQLWTYILNITPQKPTTPDQQKQVDAFRAFIDKTFAPRDCNSI